MGLAGATAGSAYIITDQNRSEMARMLATGLAIEMARNIITYGPNLTRLFLLNTVAKGINANIKMPQ